MCWGKVEKKKKKKKKTAYVAKRMPEQNTISNSNSISIFGIPVTDSRHIKNATKEK